MPTAPELVFPWVVPTSEDATCFEGPISCSSGSISGLWLRLDNVPAGGGTLEGAVLHCSPELSAALSGQEHAIKQRLRDSASVAAFFTEVQSLLERRVAGVGGPAGRSLPGAGFYAAVLQQCQDLGWGCVRSVSEDMQSIAICVRDSRDREHLVHCRLPPEFPKAPPATECELPAQLDLQWPMSGLRSLTAVHRAYAEAIERWQPLWASLEDLDRHCWVLEPEQPRRSDLFRRVSLGGFCSLRVTLDPEDPLGPPEARFLGPDAAAAPLRKRWNEAVAAGAWSRDCLLRVNAEQVLGMELPAASSAGGDDGTDAGVCGICYSYYCIRDAEGTGAAEESDARETPDVNCDNPPCGRPFHRSCLVEWLRGLTDTRQSFNMLFGQCVYCSAPLSVKIADDQHC